MTNEQKRAELLSAGEAAAFASELANANIRKYLELHSDRGAKFGMKITDAQAKFSMKIADETVTETSEIVRRSADLAARNLQAFIATEKGEI